MSQRKAVVPATSPAKKRRAVVLLLAAVLAIVVVTATMSMRGAASGTATGGTFTARRGRLPITVTEGGSIRAWKSIKYTCEVERRGGSNLTILSIVPAGTYVTQADVNNGMVLVEMDSSAIKEQLVREKMDLAAQQEGSTSAKEANDIQVIQNESDIADGQLKVRFALMNLQKYMGARLADLLTKDVSRVTSLTDRVVPLIQRVRDDPNLLDGSGAGQDLKKFNDDIVMAQGNVKNAQATLAGTERLHDANYISDLDLDRDRLSVTNRQFALENALVSLDLFLRYDFPKNAEQYLSDYVEANRQLERTYAQCRSKLAQAQARLANAREQVAEQTLTVAWFESMVGKCVIRAKAPGLVIYGTGTSSDSFAAMRGRGGGGGGGGSSGIIAAGESVYQGQTLISMPDTASMIADISVHETEVDKVRPGQAARIVMDAFPDQALQGQVIEVAPLPDEQQGFMNPDLKVYKTQVSIDGTHDFLKTRMSCKVEIFVQQLEDVIFVPIQVVANRDGKKVVYLDSGHGAAEKREVQTGAFNDTFVQIVDGLKEGEEVLLNPPMFMETAAPAAFQPARSTDAEPDGPEGPGMNGATPGKTKGTKGKRGSGRSGDPNSPQAWQGMGMRTRDPNGPQTEQRVPLPPSEYREEGQGGQGRGEGQGGQGRGGGQNRGTR